MKKPFILIFLCLGLISQAHSASPFEMAIKNNAEEIKEAKDAKIKFITEGKGIWINIWNYPKDVNAFIKKLNKYQMDTIYLQINRSTTEAFANKKGLDDLLKAAHASNIKVIGWSYCYLRKVNSDVRKFVEPALYTSPNGDHLDGMAADIEENTQLWAVTEYTKSIKKKLPKDYPLIAIVFSPRIKSQYPWEYIASNWDVLMPMTYWHGIKHRNDETVYNFVKDSITKLKQLTKKEDLKIHLITDGDKTNRHEVEASLKAARDHGINAGVSIYPEHLASEDMLETLKSFDCNFCGT